ncbi:TetR family transcriptional regulator [Streptacidiphilus pinicola]|uniref:TetR family transcriptional regulator n=1 Tax=Streptacidiphilus pinicola TaxID=2219663 RepID=A0A2X0ICI8_9ACTN|nr:TetR-like C-terminal domain-containing protein [Streptacidiphilus pinicola]RAG81303.1 TetR family transcriptional regulator [Streptacidiphilus pinicola]
MPTPDRTSLEAIVEAGRDIVESEGPTGLTMQAVAARVGVRPPSLYKRVKNRDDLIRLITKATIRDLGDRLAAVEAEAGTGDASGPELDPRRTLADMARALRGFAHTRPAGFGLVFAPQTSPGGADVEAMTVAVAPLLRVAATLAGQEYELEAARTVTAWASGFIAMELAGAFNLGGDVDRAFEFGISRLADALAARPAN